MIHDLLSGHTASIGPAIVHRFNYDVPLFAPHIATCDCGWTSRRLLPEDDAILAAVDHFSRVRRPEEAQLALF